LLTGNNVPYSGTRISGFGVDTIYSLEDFHFYLVQQVMLLSYILNASKNIYPTPNVSITFIAPLETSYEISLLRRRFSHPTLLTGDYIVSIFLRTQSTSRMQGLIWGWIMMVVVFADWYLQIMITFVYASSFLRNMKTLLMSVNLYS
jgi:hypothetical protein